MGPSLSPSKLGVHKEATPFNMMSVTIDNVYVSHLIMSSMIKLLSPSKFDNDLVVVKWMLVSDTTSKMIAVSYELSSTCRFV